MDRYYGRGVSNAYLGDEDQGQMSAWFVMSALGLFQTDGGCRADPIYEIGSPLYEKVVIDLGKRYGRGKTFTIEAKNTSRRSGQGVGIGYSRGICPAGISTLLSPG